jgi:hypothetical protein
MAQNIYFMRIDWYQDLTSRVYHISIIFIWEFAYLYYYGLLFKSHTSKKFQKVLEGPNNILQYIRIHLFQFNYDLLDPCQGFNVGHNTSI